MDETPSLSQARHPGGGLRWLFSESFYRARHADVTEATLAGHGVTSRWEHYLLVGDREGRAPSVFFDPSFYMRQLAPDEAGEAAAEGAFAHFARGLAAGVGEARCSPYFDHDAYRRRYPQVASEIAAGHWTCALHHYLCNDTPTAFDPLPEFSERYYLEHDPDVAAAVAAGTEWTGYLHFLKHGALELRSPCAAIDLAWYAATHESVRHALETQSAPDAFTHYLMFGRAQGLTTAPDQSALPDEPEADALVRLRTEALLSVLGRGRLDFACAALPQIAVMMVTRNDFPAAMATLAAVCTTFPGTIEMILVDCGSADDTRFIDRFVSGATVLRLDGCTERVTAINAALGCATADAVLLLEPGLEPDVGAIAAALARLASDARIGAVGGRIIRPHGRLHEAGGIVWNDGSTQLYLHNAPATAPEAGFTRDVDFCSGLMLLLRTTLLRELGGFDETLDAEQAVVDLCLRMREAGRRVVYDPAMIGYCRTVDPVESATAAPVLRRKHAALLHDRPARGTRAAVFARDTGGMRKRVLFVDDTVPLRIAGSGFVRSNDLIGVMASLGLGVTVFPLDPPPLSAASISAEIPDSVEVMADRSAADLERFLADRAGIYDAIWIARTHNLARIHGSLERGLAGAARPLLVLDTEAIVALRDAEQARIRGTTFDLDTALTREFQHGALCQRVIAVSEQEARVLREAGLADVSVIGHMRDVRLTPRGFSERSGMLFLGAIHEAGSPNHDALQWFIEQVLPLIERELGWQTRLTVAGYLAPGMDLGRWRGHARVTLRGAVSDTAVLYDTHRVFVAPTRFAAGVPYKVHEAVSFGLPVVATCLLAGQLGWCDGDELLAAGADDPAGFAGAVVRLLGDEALWTRLRDAAAKRIAAEHGRERYAAAVGEVLGL